MRTHRILAAAVVLVGATAVAHAILTKPAPAPTPLKPNAGFDYGTGSFTSQADCQSYLPGGANENSSWPSGAIAAAEQACCTQTANEFHSSGPRTGLRCNEDGAMVWCDGADCDE